MIILFGCSELFFLILFLAYRTDAPSKKALVFKILTSLSFLAISGTAAVTGTAMELPHNGHPAGFPRDLVWPWLIFAGQFLGLLGDIWLDLKFIRPEKDRPYTNAGFVSFGLGHILFVEALLYVYRGADLLRWVLVPALFAAAFGVVLLPLGKKLGMDFGAFRGITVVYGMLLCFLMLFACGLLIKSGFSDRRLWLFSAGTVLFAASDLILGGTYFGQGHDRPGDVIANHTLYYAAQFLIAVSAVL